MAVRRLKYYLCGILMACQLAIFFHFILTPKLFKATNDRNDNKLLRVEERLVKASEELSNTKIALNSLRKAYAALKKVKNCTKGTKFYRASQPQLGRTQSFNRPQRLAYEPGLFGSTVTVILYGKNVSSTACLESKVTDLQNSFPNLTVLTFPGSKANERGHKDIKFVLSKVKTKYVFFLSDKHDINNRDPDHGPEWLLHALENIPDLDFVSGSILEQDKLEIPCYRLKTCNWTLSQKYEYYRGVGDVMICDELSPSFIGRMSSLNKFNLLFDKNIISLSTTDFFLRAKEAGAVSGVRPEVFLQTSSTKSCKESLKRSRRQEFLDLLPFAHKHKVFRFRLIDSDELDLCDLKTSPIIGEDICDESIAHERMLGGGHWAYDGTFAYPFMLKNLQYCLFEVTDVLTSKGIPYAVTAGVALGAVKMRGILPWEAGDVDVDVYHHNKGSLFKILVESFEKQNYTVLEMPEQVQVFCAPKSYAHKVGGLVSMFVHSEEKPDLIQMLTDGRWVKYRKDVFKSFRNEYSVSYFEHKMYGHKASETIQCKRRGHNACLPDFASNGNISGTLREHFCSI